MAGKAKKSEGDGGGGGGKGKSPMLMMIVVLIAGLAGGVFAGKNFLAPKAPPPPKPPTVGKTLDLGEFIVNLGDENYLKAGVALGLKEGIDPKKLEEETAPLRDAALMALRRQDALATEHAGRQAQGQRGDSRARERGAGTQNAREGERAGGLLHLVYDAVGARPRRR
jgi:flagellar basal body-associated protein FliL